MGVMYVVIALLPEHRDEIEAWLRSLDIACPEGEGRYPSLQELRAVLDHLDGYAISYSTDPVFLGNWYADIVRADQRDGNWALIVANDYNGNETDTHEFYFERGAPRVMLPILQRLVTACGPLILLPDTGALPVVVTSELDLDQAVHELES
jgi:hypothetical protein